MSRVLLAAALAAALVACGGKSSQPATAPLPPDEAPVTEKPPQPEPEPAPEPAPPPQPTTITVPAETTTVKLLKPGKGKKAKLAYTLTAGTKQAFETALLVTSSAGQSNTVMPKMVLAYSGEVVEVAPDGVAKVRLVLTKVSFEDIPGQTIATELLTEALGSLEGLTSEYTVNPQGQMGDQTVTFPAGAQPDASMTQQIIPTLVALPVEPVGKGATWEVGRERVSTFAAAARTVYTLKSRKGEVATVEGKTTITGAPQTLEEEGFKAEVTKLEGSGKNSLEIRTGWIVSIGTVGNEMTIGLKMGDQTMETKSSTSMTTTAK